MRVRSGCAAAHAGDGDDDAEREEREGEEDPQVLLDVGHGGGAEAKRGSDQHQPPVGCTPEVKVPSARIVPLTRPVSALVSRPASMKT